MWWRMLQVLSRPPPFFFFLERKIFIKTKQIKYNKNKQKKNTINFIRIISLKTVKKFILHIKLSTKLSNWICRNLTDSKHLAISRTCTTRFLRGTWLRQKGEKDRHMGFDCSRVLLCVHPTTSEVFLWEKWCSLGIQHLGFTYKLAPSFSIDCFLVPICASLMRRIVQLL